MFCNGFPEVRGLDCLLFFSYYKSHWDEYLHDQNVVYISCYLLGIEFQKCEFPGGSKAINIFKVLGVYCRVSEDGLYLF